jgi:hypothetical protein
VIALAVQDVEHCRRFAVADVVPVDRGSKEATFTAWAADFAFDDKVRSLFFSGYMENLEDFRYYLPTRRRSMRLWPQRRR